MPREAILLRRMLPSIGVMEKSYDEQPMYTAVSLPTFDLVKIKQFYKFCIVKSISINPGNFELL